MITTQKRNIGINFNEQGAEVRLWAPYAEKVEICINSEKTIPLIKRHLGYWYLFTKMLQAGDRYEFILNNDRHLPDPASLSQPDGVKGTSEAIDLAGFKWTDQQWVNPALHTYIFYELHTGTFSPEGNFEAVGRKIGHLKQLGITALELMPVSAFPGTRNWGYDVVFPFAVQKSYGGAQELQKLVNLCHEQGIAVVLDVVFNHMDVEGNYLGDYGPYFTKKYKTPWGNAVNFDDAGCDSVRQYFIENALMWFRDFHIDALRLEAVHDIRDFGPVHILRAIREKADELMAHTGKTYYLIVECNLNDTRFINPLQDQGYGMHAQWNDEFHHALRVAAGQKPRGYYADFNGVSDLAKAYKQAYVYDGQYSPYRDKTFGTKAEHNTGDQFVVFSQNHNQIGNRMMGERSSELMSFAMQKLIAGAVMVSPYLPLLFMGEEWAEPHPFLYFTEHNDRVPAKPVKKGRREKHRYFQPPQGMPDPFDKSSFEYSQLQWRLIEQEPHATLFKYYQALIKLRSQYLPLNLFTRNQLDASYNFVAQSIQLHRWNGDQHIYVFMNFSDKRQTVALPFSETPWHKLLYSEDLQWKGRVMSPATVTGGVPFYMEPESFLVYSSHE